jgi:hypothetical protein
LIIPMLTYSSKVWWPRARYNASRTELIKVNREVCLAITGVMKVTPTAELGIYRLMCTQN